MLNAVKRESQEITSVQRESGCVLLYSRYGVLRLAPKSETIIRVIFTRKDTADEVTGVGIVTDSPFTDWELEEQGGFVNLRTSSLTVSVNKASGSISYYNSQGSLLLAERDFESHMLEEFDAYRTSEEEAAETESVVTPDGVKQKIKSAVRVFDKKLCRTRIHFKWQEGEALYGLGQSAENTLNLRGTTQFLHQANMKIAIPFLISSNGYGILLATASPCVFHDTAYGSFIQTEADTKIDFYFIAGEYADIIKSYRYLTGKAAMLPKWAFGYLQSQERYETADELIAVADEYRKRKIPLDSVILDWMSWEGDMWGQKTFDAKRFPDPTAMMKALHEKNVKLMISIWPTMNRQTLNYDEFKKKGLMLPFSDIYNAFEEEGRKLYWKQANEGLFSHGVDAWWCDSSEPFTPEWSKKEKPEPSALYHEFLEEAGKFVPMELSNSYGLFHARGIYEGQRSVTDSKRVTNLTRSAWTGQQRYGVILWSGDTAAKWETLRQQITAGLNFCACGLPYWTLDIGAFFVKPGPTWFWDGDYPEGSEDLGYRELYVRWFQYGAFLPVFRAHGTDTRREIWAYGKPGEPFYDALCSAVALRYRLMPYIYSLAGAAWLEDATIIRLLAFDFPEDKQVLNIADQYMFGPSVMVCPVTEPMYYQAGSLPVKGAVYTRKVYLPEGTGWYDFWTNKKYAGGVWIEAAAELERIPLFIKAGAVIPLTEPAQYTGAKSNMPLTVQVYPGKNGEFMLYDDSGDGYGYENGEYTLIKLVWDDAAGKLTSEAVHDYLGTNKPAEFTVKVM
ncbi:MAG: glycoside hydrolase family 31 protein [Clostridiales bacterium]|jgi:alpha-D-xyloside xylohydrolase|nr:glycoside hydrolase family 31 protein [Clostridiales bacterium]